jgi:hypothetical protein
MLIKAGQANLPLVFPNKWSMMRISLFEASVVTFLTRESRRCRVLNSHSACPTGSILLIGSHTFSILNSMSVNGMFSGGKRRGLSLPRDILPCLTAMPRERWNLMKGLPLHTSPL